MKITNFSYLYDDFPLINEKDKDILNSVFKNKEDILESISFIEKIESIVKYLLYLIFGSSIFIYLIMQNKIYIIYWLVFLIPAIILVVILNLKIEKESKKLKLVSKKEELKNDIISKIDKNIKYSKSAEFYPWWLEELKEMWLLSDYDRLDYQEDSILMNYDDINNNNLIEIIWKEIKTSNKDRTEKWRVIYITSNHFYILKVKLNNPKYNLTSDIKIIKDFNEKYPIKKQLFLIFKIVAIFILISVVTIYYDFIIFSITLSILKAILLILIVKVIYSIYYFSKTKNERIKLENKDFENKFDVYSKDEIEAKKILTPTNIQRIYEYTNRINKKRVYEFYFKNNFIFIKLDFKQNKYNFFEGNYLNIKNSWNVREQVKDIINFYQEIKSIKILFEDLKLIDYIK